jgi:hypothetical protein
MEKTRAPAWLAAAAAMALALLPAAGAGARAAGGNDPSVVSDQVERTLQNAEQVHDAVGERRPDVAPAPRAPTPAGDAEAQRRWADFDARAAGLARQIGDLLEEQGIAKEALPED